MGAPFDLPPLTADAVGHIERSFFRAFGASIHELVAAHGRAYLDDMEAHLDRLKRAFPERPWPAWSMDGFLSFNREVVRSELAFAESGAYEAGPEDFEQVRAAVYDSEEVMLGHYMVGLYLTYLIWPHHYDMLRFYRRAFLRPDAGVSQLMEWGVGHGLFTLEALGCWPGARSLALDLSEHAVAFSTAILAAEGLSERCELRVMNVLEGELPAADRLVCSEVLEHVTRPDLLLDRLREVLAADGEAFLTAAVSAPQPDHIQLWRHEQEVLDLVASHGLHVTEHTSVRHPNRAGDEDPPRVLAMVLRREG